MTVLPQLWVLRHAGSRALRCRLSASLTTLAGRIFLQVDGSFHSKAYQAQYIASLTARLPEVPASFECLRFQPNVSFKLSLAASTRK